MLLKQRSSNSDAKTHRCRCFDLLLSTLYYLIESGKMHYLILVAIMFEVFVACYGGARNSRHIVAQSYSRYY